MSEKTIPYLVAFFSSFLLTLVLTPVIREINRKLGLVDNPDARRINTVPIPRGGGLAIALGLFLSYFVFILITGRPAVQELSQGAFYRLSALSVAIALLGLVDDKFSLPPRIKLAGQMTIAFLVWFWAGLGFRGICPFLPAWLDCILTVFWITGAVNAFNLIDGLDGLASGISLIAAVGMAGSCFFIQNPQASLFYLALAGALVGFLRYNYNPASVFLGDCGSMFLGFVLSTQPLISQAPGTYLVSIGVPLLAMGVPIFDTALAIVRRTLRRLLLKGTPAEGSVMSADSDHLHHRILRAVGLNQRKAAWVLYGITVGAVLIGFVAMFLESHAAGLWIAALALAAVVIFKDSTIELFDAGRLLESVAHTHNQKALHRQAVLSVPFYACFDILAAVAAFFICSWSIQLDATLHTFRAYLPVRVVSLFVFLVFFKTYRTVWSRALGSNYVRLFLACLFGSVVGSLFIYYWPSTQFEHIGIMTLAYALTSFILLLLTRVIRAMVRDVFYAIDCARLRNRKDVSRILVYGGGLRYRAFRRELVRTTSANDRIIVGILDDNIFLKGKYIGGIRIFGTIHEAPEIINRYNVDAVVIACQISEEGLETVRGILRPTGVKMTKFSFSETPV